MEDNPIIIENETNKMYTVYKDVKSKTDNAKYAYVDLTTKISALDELYKQKKTELDTITAHISSEKLAWATEKAEEWRKISDRNAELDNALKLKAELNTQQEEIRKSTQEGIDARNETRQIELSNKTTELGFENREKEIADQLKAVKTAEVKQKNKEKEFSEKLIKLVNDYK